MADRRGPLFRLLGLHGFRCYTCRRDVLWRKAPPVVCRWCGGLAIDFPALARSAARIMAAFADSLEDLIRVASSTSDQFASLRDAVKSLTRVDTPPEHV